MRSLYSGILNIEDETLQNEACRIVIRVTKQKIEMETLILIVEIYIGLHKNVQNLLQFLRSRIESGKMNKHIIHELSLENLFQKFDRRIALTKAFTTRSIPEKIEGAQREVVPVGLITEAKTVINPFSRSLCVHRVLFIVEIYRVSPRAIVPLVLACTRAPRSFVGTPVHKGGRIVEEERGRGGGRGGGRRKNEKRKKKGTTASRTQRVPPSFDSKPNGPGEKE